MRRSSSRPSGEAGALPAVPRPPQAQPRRSLRSILHRSNIRRVYRLHAYDVVSGVDMVHFAGDATSHIGEKVEGGLADILDRDRATQGGIVLVPLQDIAEVADSR